MYFIRSNYEYNIFLLLVFSSCVGYFQYAIINSKFHPSRSSGYSQGFCFGVPSYLQIIIIIIFYSNQKETKLMKIPWKQSMDILVDNSSVHFSLSIRKLLNILSEEYIFVNNSVENMKLFYITINDNVFVCNQFYIAEQMLLSAISWLTEMAYLGHIRSCS